jgi:hypothetical protein
MTDRRIRIGEQLAVALILLGILMMVQPVVLDLLAYGFVLVLIGLVLFIVVSHL